MHDCRTCRGLGKSCAKTLTCLDEDHRGPVLVILPPYAPNSELLTTQLYGKLGASVVAADPVPCRCSYRRAMGEQCICDSESTNNSMAVCGEGACCVLRASSVAPWVNPTWVMYDYCTVPYCTALDFAPSLFGSLVGSSVSCRPTTTMHPALSCQPPHDSFIFRTRGHVRAAG